LEQLDEGLQPNIRVMLISAPAGYGKTTLLTTWLQNREIAAAWLSISEGDNDPTRFMSYLINSIELVSADLELPPVGERKIADEEFKESFLIPTINQIGRLTKQTVIVLDDYHLIHSQAIHDQIGYLVENLPPQAHVYIATRADPPLPFARLRGRGQVNELRTEDLRFRKEETETFLNVFSDLHFTSDDLNTLYRRTEGWICGLQMATAFLRGQEDVQATIQGFSGSHYYIMDYLLDEVLRREPPEMQTFLLQTSILERLSGSLCDAMCGVASQTPSPSQQFLRKLEQANLFIVPLDERRMWYRYHGLFSDLLQTRLHDEDAQQIPILNRRASEWFAANDLMDEAVQHAFLAGDDNFAADTVELYSQEILLRGETMTFLG
jgi:LuxR family maltose regulon positive regulatory protein